MSIDTLVKIAGSEDTGDAEGTQVRGAGIAVKFRDGEDCGRKWPKLLVMVGRIMTQADGKLCQCGVSFCGKLNVVVDELENIKTRSGLHLEVCTTITVRV